MPIANVPNPDVTRFFSAPNTEPVTVNAAPVILGSTLVRVNDAATAGSTGGSAWATGASSAVADSAVASAVPTNSACLGRERITCHSFNGLDAEIG